jgi:DNA-directed RNA polymerase subunit RPC12/RpoP
MPITDDNRIIYEYRCLDCGHETEGQDKPPKLPLRDCPECDDGRMQHVGPQLDKCDKCGQGLLYHGNSGLGRDTLCDNCYDRMEAMM